MYTIVYKGVPVRQAGPRHWHPAGPVAASRPPRQIRLCGSLDVRAQVRDGGSGRRHEREAAGHDLPSTGAEQQHGCLAQPVFPLSSMPLGLITAGQPDDVVLAPEPEADVRIASQPVFELRAGTNELVSSGAAEVLEDQHLPTLGAGRSVLVRRSKWPAWHVVLRSVGGRRRARLEVQVYRTPQLPSGGLGLGFPLGETRADCARRHAVSSRNGYLRRPVDTHRSMSRDLRQLPLRRRERGSRRSAARRSICRPRERSPDLLVRRVSAVRSSRRSA